MVQREESIYRCLKFLLALLCWSLSGQALYGQPSSSETCIRDVVWAEARGESSLGQSAVAWVVLNRARETKQSPCSVVKQRGQFRRMEAPRSFRVSTEGPDPTKGATHFRTKYVKSWLGLKPYITIGGHVFYGP